MYQNREQFLSQHLVLIQSLRLKKILSEIADEIRVHPLSFAEYYSAVGGDKNEAFDEYAFYGGMPLILSINNADTGFL